MKKLGLIICAIGALILLGSFKMDTAPEGTYNIGLQQEQLMIFQLGCLLAILGGISAIAGFAMTRLENAGIIPPVGYKVSNPGRKV